MKKKKVLQINSKIVLRDILSAIMVVFFPVFFLIFLVNALFARLNRWDTLNGNYNYFAEANYYQVFHRIIFKISISEIANIVIFKFLWERGPYLTINTQEKQLLPVGSKTTFFVQNRPDYESVFAITVFSTVPALIVYFMFQNQFIERLTSSALNG